MATGKTLGGGARRAGFTMVEVMIVIAIILLLAGLLAVAAARQQKQASVHATESLIKRIQGGIEEYRDIKGSYPPDGYDTEIVNADGVAIRGAACLYQFLGQPLTVQKTSSGRSRTNTVEPLVDFKEDEISRENQAAVAELIDAFGRPLHYDNTENGQFNEQDGSAHMEEELVHPPDPRLSVDYKSVEEEGNQGKGYDLWSHGPSGHNDTEDLSDTIASWTIGRDDK